MGFGFHCGEAVSCLNALGFGVPKVYRISDTVYSLDGEVAAHIMVKIIPRHG